MKKIIGCILLALIFFALSAIMAFVFELKFHSWIIAIFASVGVFALATIIGGLVWLAIELIND